MKTIDELKEFYNQTLIPELKTLETSRKATLSNLIVIEVIILSIASVIFFLTLNIKNIQPIIFGATIALSGFAYSAIIKNYTNDFKKRVIKKIVGFIDNKLSYQENGRVSIDKFELCRIFLKSPDKYNGEDYVSGKLDKTNIEFSEVHAEYVTEDSKGRKQDHTIFKGLFFIADFNKNFTGTTFVLPDTAQKLFGGIGSFLQSRNPSRPDLVKLEDPEFEKYFVVYGTDQVESRYILSTSLMSRIVEFKKRSEKQLYISFADSKLFMAVNYSKNILEPPIFRTLIDFNLIKEYFEDLELAVGIVETLNLNTRIWGKH